MWLRATLIGLPADVAIEHQPRSALIALGIRGMVLVVLTYLAWTALGGALLVAWSEFVGPLA